MSNMGWWLGGTVATLVFIGFVAMIVRDNARPFDEERRLAVELAQAGEPVVANVLALERQTGGRPFAAPMKLSLCYTDAGSCERHAELRAYIDPELLANFMPGKTVHLRYDRQHPARIAIDRQLSPTEIPAAWRSK